MDPFTILLLATGAGLFAAGAEAKAQYDEHKAFSIEGVEFPPGVADRLRSRGVNTLDHVEMLNIRDLIRLGLTREEAEDVEKALHYAGRSLSPERPKFPLDFA